MIKLVAFDFDKVLIDTETIDEIAKINHTDKEISKITQEAMEGKISFETSIKKRVSLLKGINTNEIKKVLKPIPYTIGAKETVKELKKRGYIIAIITGSFTIITDEVKKELNPDYVFSNILETEDGKLTGKITGPLITHDKIDVLKNLIKDLNISLEECAAIGDGANDLNMVKNVALGISFNGKPILEENADKLINKKDLRMVLDIMTDEEKKTNEETTEESGKIELKIKNYSETLNDLKEQGNNGDNEKEETIDEQPETEEETTKET
ncbi:MAG: phosphoserine phosphatase SerB, partial [Methanobacteriaceae archaeon]|nr:phosphoserine phosphatase SerB [Methanobacteriaceae archaeon]